MSLRRPCVVWSVILLTLVSWAFLAEGSSISQTAFRWPTSLWVPCYNDPPIGCFPITAPYDNSQGFWPQSPRTVNVRFHFYNKQIQHLFSLSNTLDYLRDTFNPNVKTVVLIHGYMEDGNSAWIQRMVAEFVAYEEPINIVVVDWSANSFIYYQSVANTRVVGALVALFLRTLMSLGAQPSSFHLIGYSLGAHTAGYTGTNLTGIGRITGLDPAGPAFADAHASARLDPTDALFVDVVHTNAAPANLMEMGKGTLVPLGTVDFYPNGGMVQPGCPDSIAGRISAFFTHFDFTSSSLTQVFGCSHTRAAYLFSATIRRTCSSPQLACQSENELTASACRSCVTGECPTFGFHLNTSVVPSQRIITSVTTAEWPFC